MSPGATSQRVYDELRRRLLAGSLAPGRRLEPALLSQDLFASITPIRDALHRLAGERLVDTPHHDGFRVPAPTEAGLRDLYRFNLWLLSLALRGHPRVPAATPWLVGQGGIERLFAAIGAVAGSAELVAAIAALGDRLAPFRRAEACLFADLDEELARLSADFGAGHLAGLRGGLGRYHNRRIRAAPDILVRRGT